MAKTWDILPELGFEVVPDPWSTGVAYELVLGKSRLSAAQRLNRFFREVIIFSGVYSTSNSIAEVDFELPLNVASIDQCKAFLAYYLLSYIGDDQALQRLTWFEEGKSQRHLLPWNIEAAKYQARPHCYVKRDWLKLVLKDLREQLSSVTGHTMVEFSFDGLILSICIDGNTILVSAQGDAWNQSIVIPAARLLDLPKRLQSQLVEIGVYDDRLILGNYRYQGVKLEKKVIPIDVRSGLPTDETDPLVESSKLSPTARSPEGVSMAEPWVCKGRSDRSAFVAVDGEPSMRRSPDGVWSFGIPSADEFEDDFILVTDPKERKALVKEASMSAPFLKPAHKPSNGSNDVAAQTAVVKPKYSVFVDDNFHYMDESERYLLGEFDTREEAIQTAKAIVDAFLIRGYEEGISAEKLHEQYRAYGEDPFISPRDENAPFSAWGYAKIRCDELCGPKRQKEATDAENTLGESE